MLKEKQKTLMIEVENTIIIGNEAITATVIHQVCLYKKDDGEIGTDVDFIDVINVEFLGIPLKDQSYTGFRNFKREMFELGIDIDKLIDEECYGLISTSELQQLKNKYRDIFS